MNKKERQKLISEIIRNKKISKQETLVDLLKSKGIWVTQTTISRDIKEMRISKLPIGKGNYIYELPLNKKLNDESRLRQFLSDAFIEIKQHENQCYIKVLPGNGPVLADILELVDYKEIFALISDDGAVMIFAYSSNEAKIITQKILNLLKK